jgi:hypothetical protein
MAPDCYVAGARGSDPQVLFQGVLKVIFFKGNMSHAIPGRKMSRFLIWIKFWVFFTGRGSYDVLRGVSLVSAPALSLFLRFPSLKLASSGVLECEHVVYHVKIGCGWPIGHFGPYRSIWSPCCGLLGGESG